MFVTLMNLFRALSVMDQRIKEDTMCWMFYCVYLGIMMQKTIK